MPRGPAATIPSNTDSSSSLALVFLAAWLTVSFAGCSTTSPPIAVSEFYSVRHVSHGIGIFKWHEKRLFVRSPGNELQFLGSTGSGEPRGVDFLGDAVKQLREINLAVSKDGRSIVFLGYHSPKLPPSGAGLDPETDATDYGVFQYTYGGELRRLFRADEMSGSSYRSWWKEIPSDILPVDPRETRPPGGTLAVRATGEVLPLALLEASPLHWAAYEGRASDCAKLVEEGASINATALWNFTALDLAVIGNHQDAAITLLDLGADPDAGYYSAYHSAAAQRRLELVEAMLKRGTDVNATDVHGLTALHAAVTDSNFELAYAGRFFRNFRGGMDLIPGLARELLEHGADAEIRSKAGKKPLDWILDDYRMALSTLPVVAPTSGGPSFLEHDWGPYLVYCAHLTDLLRVMDSPNEAEELEARARGVLP